MAFAQIGITVRMGLESLWRFGVRPLSLPSNPNPFPSFTFVELEPIVPGDGTGAIEPDPFPMTDPSSPAQVLPSCRRAGRPGAVLLLDIDGGAVADGDVADRVEAAPSTAMVLGLFQDIPGWIWKVFLGAWATFFGLMLVFFATSPTALFMVMVSVLFALMIFGLTKSLAAQSQCADYTCEGAIDTHTGPLSARAAGVQIALIPVAVVVGLLGFVVLAM